MAHLDHCVCAACDHARQKREIRAFEPFLSGRRAASPPLGHMSDRQWFLMIAAMSGITVNVIVLFIYLWRLFGGRLS